jgi:outer membrane protein assembly factor BamB
LRAWDAASGQPLWQRNLPDDYNPDVDYGFCWSPLVETSDNGDVLILNAGSRGLSIRTRDGSIAWGDDRQKSACVSAVPFEHRGTRGVLVVGINSDRSAANLIGVDPRSGRELWRFDGWPEQWGAIGVDPIVHEGKVFITSTEQYRQAARYSIDGGTLRQDWSSRVAGYTGCAVLLNKHLYVVDSNGILKCVDWESGAVQWNQRGFDERGSLMAADGELLVQTGASGDLVIVAADATSYRELGRMQVFESAPTTFTAAVLSGGRIYCRSYAGEVLCLQGSAAT